ncbi:MAG: response regulator [Gaiellaceae bacterium]
MGAPSPSSAALRVLIADDSRMFAEALMTSLARDERLEIVGLAHDGVEAVSLAQELSPDVVLMDLEMPLKDGFDATREIRQLSPSTLVIVLTRSDSPEDAHRAREAGAAGFVTKDHTTHELVDSMFEIASLALAFGAGPRRAGTN